MKALVLCAGRGHRLRPLTHTRAKAALPVGGRPVLHHVLDYLQRFGFSQIGLVVGPQQEELARLAAGREHQEIRIIMQHHPRGIAQAVSVSRPFLGEEPFLLYLGDNLTDEDLTGALHRFAAERPAALVSLRQVADPSAFGVAEVDGGRILRVVEKPAEPRSDLAIAGIYLFSPAVHDTILTLQPSARGELEITDAIAGLLAQGEPVLAHRMQGWWQDMGSVEGILAANALLLDQVQTRIDPTAVLQDVAVQGRVVIGPHVRLHRVRLRGPLAIGAGSHLADCYVGPYTAVGDGARIEQVAVENSILLPGCQLKGPDLRLEDSLIGSGAAVCIRESRSLSLLVGDDARLLLPPDRR